MNVYLYLRVSNKIQNSFERQENNIKQWLTSRSEIGEYTIKGTYLDKGRSAYSGEHLKYGLRDILDDIAGGVIGAGSIIVAESVDRFSRQGIKVGEDTINKILDAGVYVGCVRQNILANPSADERANDLGTKLSLIIALKLAYEESSQKSDRILKTFAIKREQGIITSDCPRWLQVSEDRKSFEVIAQHQHTLEQIFKLRLQGLGTHRISLYLNQNISQYPTFTKRKEWSKRIVEKYLSMPQVYGQHKDNESYYPVVIPKSTWLQAQGVKVVQGRVSSNKEGQATTNLFRGLIVCYVCGGTMYVSKQQRAATKLCCKSRVYQKNGCSNLNKYYAPFEKMILDWLSTDINKHFSESDKNDKATITLLNDKISGLFKQRDNLIEALEHSTNTNVLITLTKRLEGLTEAIDSTQSEINNLQQAQCPTESFNSITLDTEELRRVYSVRISKIIKCIVPVYSDPNSRGDIEACLVELVNGKVIEVYPDCTDKVVDALTNSSDKDSVIGLKEWVTLMYSPPVRSIH